LSGRSKEAIEIAAAEINASKTNANSTLVPLQMDVTDDTSIENAAAYVEKELGSLDILVNNAGAGGLKQDLRTRLTTCLNTNVIGAALVANAFRPLLLKSSNPYTIHVSSGAGSLAGAEKSKPTFEGEEAYRMSKAALNMFAVWEYVEYGKQGLKVFPICPGFVVSNLRGKDEESRTGWGHAKSADTSGHFILSVARGERDADVGKFIKEDGMYPW
jgi:NAD(P)-dependent dehydrogenase (short-subunit alcohol dehydrogenase family)